MGYGVCAYIVTEYHTILKCSQKGLLEQVRKKASRKLNGNRAILLQSRQADYGNGIEPVWLSCRGRSE